MPRPSHNAYAYAFGDVPYVCGELRTGSRRGKGEVAELTTRPSSYDIAHRDSVNNR